MTTIRYSIFMVFVFILSLPLYAEMRTWTASGYKIEAEFVRFDDVTKNVELKGETNKMFDVKFDLLSKEDQEYVQKHTHQSRGDGNPFKQRSETNTPSETPQSKRIRYALLVGVNDYKTLQPLRFSCNDVNYLAEQLQKAGYEQENVVVVCDTAGKTSLTPMKENIERELNRLINKTGDNDQFFFVFCGHGLNIGNQAYLAPYDMEIPKSPEDIKALETLISVDWVYEKFAECPARVKLLFLDACQENLFASRAIREKSSIKQLDAAEFKNRNVAKNVLQFHACSPNQFSYECTELSHGVYSYFLAEGLGGKADWDNDGRINVLELHQYASDNTFRYVRDKLKKPNEQTPQFFGDLRGNPRIAELSEDTLERLKKKIEMDIVEYRKLKHAFVLKSSADKVEFWGKCAEKNIPEGEFLYGYCLFEGHCVTKDKEKALEFFNKAMTQDFYLAKDQLDEIKEMDRQTELVRQELLKKEKKQQAFENYERGLRYFKGDGVLKDYKEAFTWFHKAAEQGFASAQSNLGVCYEKGYGIDQDKEKAIKWYRKAADQGDIIATDSLKRIETETARIEFERLKKEQAEQEKTKNEERDRLRKEITEEVLHDLNKKKYTGNSSSQPSNINNSTKIQKPQLSESEVSRLTNQYIWRTPQWESIAEIQEIKQYIRQYGRPPQKR
ncbi:MAG: caspase family protein [Planctomycetaceae bacterium]|jgi:TPR repeat protein|nr:caspase family protein [Planctomycetaceae bacterium]